QLKPPVPRSGWWADAGRTALGWLILLSIWGLGLFAVVMLSNVLAAPFNDLLSEEVEHLATGARGPPFSLKVLLRDTVRTIGLELVKWAIYLAVMLVLLIVSNVVPVVGHVLSSIVGFLFTTLYLAIDYIDWPSSRRNRSIAYRFSVVREHFGAMLGFGSGVWLFLFLPLVNLLFMPAAVAGGTLMFLDLEGRGQGTAEDAP
ncbi:MAG: EI24 domain-containing protein, partial [Sandaracinaceae bacterium]